MKILGDKPIFSHMPYIHDAAGSISLLVCLSDKRIEQTKERPAYRAWKIHSYDPSTNTATRIKTGSDPLDVECSPVCYYRDGVFSLSFILGKWVRRHDHDEYRDLRLVKMNGKSLSQLGEMQPVVPFIVKAGFEWYGRAVFATHDLVMHDNIDGVGRYETDVGLERIIRLAPRHDHTTSVLVTGFRKGQEEAVTIVYDLDTKKAIAEVKTPEGASTYKPSIFENMQRYMMANVVPDGDGDEDYRVDFIKDIANPMSNIDVR